MKVIVSNYISRINIITRVLQLFHLDLLTLFDACIYKTP